MTSYRFVDGGEGEPPFPPIVDGEAEKVNCRFINVPVLSLGRFLVFH